MKVGVRLLSDFYSLSSIFAVFALLGINNNNIIIIVTTTTTSNINNLNIDINIVINIDININIFGPPVQSRRRGN